MPDQGSVRSILVKGRLPAGVIADVPGRPLGFTGSKDAKVQLNSRPLFASIGHDGMLGAVAPATWHMVDTPALDELNAWDACHALVTHGFGLTGTEAPEFAEPDVQQRWTFGDDVEHALAMAADCNAMQQDGTFPPHPADDAHPLWFRDAGHANFAGAAGDGANVCIAHLDTGFDPQHDTVPAHLLKSLQRNFVDANFPHDATDRTAGGILTNLGHGTGTLGILAGAGTNGGAPIGAAPGASVIPVRVADSVVLFKNSTIAQGFDYVHSLLKDPATHVHVVTLSMGGLASQAWADAVNALYEAGVFIVAAAGNNHGNLPTRNIVIRGGSGASWRRAA